MRRAALALAVAVAEINPAHAKIDIAAFGCGQPGTEVASASGRNGALTTALPMMCAITQLGGPSQAACTQYNEFCDWSVTCTCDQGGVCGLAADGLSCSADSDATCTYDSTCASNDDNIACIDALIQMQVRSRPEWRARLRSISANVVCAQCDCDSEFNGDDRVYDEILGGTSDDCGPTTACGQSLCARPMPRRRPAPRAHTTVAEIHHTHAHTHNHTRIRTRHHHRHHATRYLHPTPPPTPPRESS